MASAVFSVSSGQSFSGMSISVKMKLFISVAYYNIDDPHLPDTHMLLEDD